MGSMSFAENLARLTGVPAGEILYLLGERGEKAKTRMDSGFARGERGANKGRMEANDQGARAKFAPDSPTIRPAENRMDKGDSPNSPLSPRGEDESCSTCANRNLNGSCSHPIEAGLSDAPGVIRYHARDGRGCRAWRQPAPAPLEGLPEALADLIRRAGEYYGYDAEDYQLAAAVARRDPEAMRRALEADALLKVVFGGGAYD